MSKLSNDEKKIKQMFDNMDKEEKNHNVQNLKNLGYTINNEYDLIVAYIKEHEKIAL